MYFTKQENIVTLQVNRPQGAINLKSYNKFKIYLALNA